MQRKEIFNNSIRHALMNEQILAEIRNKLTAPNIASEKLAKGEKVPKEFLELALKELNAAAVLLQKEVIQHD